MTHSEAGGIPTYLGRVVRPAYWLPPAEWRTRFDAIDRELADPASDLAQGFSAAWQAGQHARANDGSQVEAERILRALIERHRDLFPGTPGWELAWATLCGVPPPRHRPGRSWAQPRVIFEERQPHYAAPPRPGRRNRYSARTRAVRSRDELDSAKARELLVLLETPLTFTATAARLRIDSGTLHRLLWRLRQQGVPIPNSAEQKRRVDVAAELQDGYACSASAAAAEGQKAHGQRA